MEKNKKNAYIIISILIVIIVGISIAYALVSSTVSMQFGNVIQEGTSGSNPAVSWNIHFVTGTVNGTVIGNDSETICGAATVNATSITIGATGISTPNSGCSWMFTIKNDGKIAGKLSSLGATAPTVSGTGESCSVNNAKNTITCKNITYKLCSALSGTTCTLQTADNSSLAYNGTKNVYVLALHNDERSISNTLNIKADTASAVQVTHTGAKFTLNYNQN